MGDQILEDTFEALDTDRDGMVSLVDLQASFNERATKLLPQLPVDWAFDIEEWCTCLVECSQKYNVKFAPQSKPTESRGWGTFFGCCVAQPDENGEVLSAHAVSPDE